MKDPKKSRRGFAAMDPEKQRELARKGGASVPASKRSFSQNPDLAAAAGSKGGSAIKSADRSFSRDRSLAAKAGQAGGLAAAKNRREQTE